MGTRLASLLLVKLLKHATNSEKAKLVFGICGRLGSGSNNGLNDFGMDMIVNQPNSFNIAGEGGFCAERIKLDEVFINAHALLVEVIQSTPGPISSHTVCKLYISLGAEDCPCHGWSSGGE